MMAPHSRGESFGLKTTGVQNRGENDGMKMMGD